MYQADLLLNESRLLMMMGNLNFCLEYHEAHLYLYYHFYRILAIILTLGLDPILLLLNLILINFEQIIYFYLYCHLLALTLLAFI